MLNPDIIDLLSTEVTEASEALLLDQLAVIDEDTCIGCTKCIQACPVDAIIGATKQMHTVIADICIGCGLCLPPCPVDCIDLIPMTEDLSATEKRKKTDEAHLHFQNRQIRLQNKTKKRKTIRISPDEIQQAIHRVLIKKQNLNRR